MAPPVPEPRCAPTQDGAAMTSSLLPAHWWNEADPDLAERTDEPRAELDGQRRHVPRRPALPDDHDRCADAQRREYVGPRRSEVLPRGRGQARAEQHLGGSRPTRSIPRAIPASRPRGCRQAHQRRCCTGVGEISVSDALDLHSEKRHSLRGVAVCPDVALPHPAGAAGGLVAAVEHVGDLVRALRPGRGIAGGGPQVDVPEPGGDLMD